MTHYDKLGVSKNASQQEIKEAYKNLVKKYHPDVYQGDKSYAEKMTKEINVAYDVLSDPNKKAAYDEELNPTPTYTYTPPKNNYSYTPPKYDRPPTDYNEYRKNYGREYNYNYRYTDYHRNKEPNSSYTSSSKIQNEFINLFDTNKLVVIFLILIIYITLLIFTFSQFYAIRNNAFSNSNKTNSTTSENVRRNTTKDNTTSNRNTTRSVYDFPDSYEDFNINNYVTDKELYDVYKNYYYDSFENFSEFREAISKELYEYYSSFY